MIRPALILGLIALMFTAIPWFVAVNFWSFGEPPARTQFAPRADAVVARIETEAVPGSRGGSNLLVWLVAAEEGSFAPGRRLISDAFRSLTPARLESLETVYAPGTEIRVRVTDDALYPAGWVLFDYLAWVVSVFCVIVSGAGLTGVFISFRMVLEGRG
ncbi:MULTISPECIES: hypothetical protein [Hyphobacterium]|uniref:DUF3592 domain-containing protein n=1 Tax=Hyphobacterium vulgare TaxID=1736751 RepID=A0ABV6ZVU9_9PROT